MACGEVVGSEEMAFELDFGDEGGGASIDSCMHVRCFAIWELERVEPRINGLPTHGEASDDAGEAGADSRSMETGRFDVTRLRASVIDVTMPEHERERHDSGESK